MGVKRARQAHGMFRPRFFAAGWGRGGARWCAREEKPSRLYVTTYSTSEKKENTTVSTAGRKTDATLRIGGVLPLLTLQSIRTRIG